MKKFNVAKKIAKSVSDMSGYVPGEQPSDGGWVKLNTNEFPYPPSPRVKRAIVETVGKDGFGLRLYPDPASSTLRAQIAKYFGVPVEFAFAANGSDDALNLAMRAFADGRMSAATIDPSYSLYPVIAKMQGAKLQQIPFGKNMEIPYAKIFKSKANIFFFTNPNAPTGVGYGADVVEKIAKKFKGIVLVDEAYAPFSGFSATSLVQKYPNLLVIGTASKGWGLAGMRIGWAVANPAIIEVLDRVRDSYNLDRLSQVAGVAALADKAYYEKLCAKIVAERGETEKFFDKLGWGYFKSSSNFILFTPKNSAGFSGARIAADLFNYLRGKKILLRYFPKNKIINMSIRLSIGSPEQMKLFRAAALKWSKIK